MPLCHHTLAALAAALFACAPSDPPRLPATPAEQPVTAVLRVADVGGAIATYEATVDARRRVVLRDERGLLHAELDIGGSSISIDRSDDNPLTLGGTSGGIVLSVTDPRATARRLAASGAVELAPGRWRDRHGHQWQLERGRRALAPALVAGPGERDRWSRAFGSAARQVRAWPPSAGLRRPGSLGGAPFRVHLYVADCDAAHQRALSAGARSIAAPALRYWGDRWAMVSDRAGHHWGLGARVETVTEARMQQRLDERTSAN